ncbi:MAG: hypothetical protein AAFY65_12975 [Pseudomonadota bacterium]
MTKHMATDVKVFAVVEMTEDMVETLAAHFDNYAKDGVVQIEVSNYGLWLPHRPSGTRQFLGLARAPGDYDA